MKSSNLHNINFIRRERRAILIIVSVTMVVHFGGKIARSNFLIKNGYVLPDSLVLVMDRLDSPARTKFEKIDIEQAFNPDTVCSKTLISWGFTEDVAVRWVKYRNLVGGFHSSSQIRAIYGIDSLFYEEIKPFMVFEKSEQYEFQSERSENLITAVNIVAVQNSQVEQHKGEQQVLIDINGANRGQWQDLYGIGPFYAERITRFRDKLGGFYSIDQVSETYFLPDSVFRTIRPFLILKTAHQNMDLNRADYSRLAGHPYISSKEAQVILRYRKQHGPYKSVDDLKKIISLDADFIRKIKPYLFVESLQ